MAAGCGGGEETSEGVSAADARLSMEISEDDSEGTQDKENEDLTDADDTAAEAEDTGEYDFTVCFTEDINLDKNWEKTAYLDSAGGQRDGAVYAWGTFEMALPCGFYMHCLTVTNIFHFVARHVFLTYD